MKNKHFVNIVILFMLNFFPAPEILNTIKWTQSLDEVFVNNWKEDPSLKWQYFGSETGVLRTYPGNLLYQNVSFY